MFIGLLQIELFIPESDSLKAKRFVLSSIKDRIKNKFNVSIAEVENNDKWQRATLGVAMVANEKNFVDQALNKVLNFVDDYDQVEVVDHRIEIF
ncbi:MAG TPA: DUF503 domain-containing protein [bacterium]|nr:DUF503 domain-containing protein [bacterium]HPN45341.1 DUF503 domain-containing protein [bacterium]